jgi:hypothetical protein
MHFRRSRWQAERRAWRIGRCAALGFIAVTPSAVPRPARAQADSAFVVMASQARVRAQPAPSAAEVARVPMGTLVRPTRGLPGQGHATRWTAVTLAGGRRGWIHADLLLPADPAHPLAAYRELAERRLSNEGGTFAEGSRLTELVQRGATLAQAGTNDAGWMALLRLLALQRSLDALLREKPRLMRYEAADVDPWLHRFRGEIAYSEPAGQWFVNADLFWRLRERYAGRPVAENIAWAAATQPIPGECEDDPECQFTLQEWTMARYLGLHPAGAHSGEALKQLGEALGWAAKSAEREPFCRPGTRGAVTPERIRKMRQAIDRASGAGRAQALAALERLAAHCPSRP